MIRTHSLRGLTLALGAALVANSCTVPFSDVLAPHARSGELFDRYVAIGNSITAGYQSGGIIDSTQRRSYAFLLAQSMGTRFQYPSLAGRGCAPLVTNFVTQARPAGTSAATCDLRTASTATDLMNNLGVPGAWSYDPNTTSSATSNALSMFFLGGKSQVQRAREMNPTFASIWIGNNDVLGPGVSSGSCTTASPVCSVTLSAITAPATFQATYDAMIDSLKATSPNLKGVLIGVVNVSNAPVLFPVSALTGTVKTAFDAIACGAATSGCFGTGSTTLHPSCTSAPGNLSLINVMLAFQIRANPGGAFPAVVACTPGVVVGAPWVGDMLVLDATEQATITTAVTAFNTYLINKASALGWAYYDPNVQLSVLRAANSVVRNAPLTTGAGAAAVFAGTGTFGTGMSLDGVHPNAAVHIIVANDLITTINAKFGTNLKTVF